MTVTFEPVTTAEQQKTLAKLAKEIWQEYWPSRIGQAQTDYMVQNFQSLEAIKRDMAENDYEYWFCTVEESASNSPYASRSGRRIVGFTGGHVEPDTNRFFISKIYLLATERGKHYASQVISFYQKLCQSRGLKAMYLTVNKYNELGIRCYRSKGFETIDSVETDIGEGFVMDDYIMEKQA